MSFRPYRGCVSAGGMGSRMVVRREDGGQMVDRRKGTDGTVRLTPTAAVPGVQQVESIDHKKYTMQI